MCEASLPRFKGSIESIFSMFTSVNVRSKIVLLW